MSRKPMVAESLFVTMFKDPHNPPNNKLLESIPEDQRPIFLSYAFGHIEPHLVKVLKLYHDQGMSIKEISKKMKKSHSTVWGYHKYGIFITRLNILKGYYKERNEYTISLN